jgi:pimeloyl-ACP methyl ester carboxylesterase
MAGRGGSAWLPNPMAYHFGQFLSDLRALLAHLGAREVEWVGTSMGGLLGMLLASEPGSPITRLVLNDVGAYVRGEALAEIGRNLRAPRRFESLAALEAHVRHTHRDWGPITAPQWSHLARHAARRVRGGYALHYDPQIASLLPPMPFAPGLSMWTEWHRVRCPVLVIRGRESRILPPDVLRTMRAVKPTMQGVEIAGAGHAPSLMAPDQVAVVATFLGDEATRLARAA